MLVVGAGGGLGGYIFSRLSFPFNILRIMRSILYSVTNKVNIILLSYPGFVNDSTSCPMRHLI